MKKQTIGLLMGIYNEAHRIEDCLNYHLHFFDEAAIVIQKSEDDTERVVKEYLIELGYAPKVEGNKVTFTAHRKPTVKVLYFPKLGSSEMTLQDGSDALTTDWVYYIDADEKHPWTFLKKMHNVVETESFDGFRFDRDNFFIVPCFAESVPIEPKTITIQHPARDAQLRLTRRSLSVFPRQIHVRCRVKRDDGQEYILSLPDTINHTKTLAEQWVDNTQYLPSTRLVDAMEMTKKGHFIEFPNPQDPARIGELVFAEVGKHLPFEVKRAFWVYPAVGESRGGHANRKLNEVVVCLQGSVSIDLDDGTRKQSFILESANKGLFIKNKTWVTLSDFDPNTILLVFASELYDPKDKINDYDAFVEEVRHDSF